MIKQNADKKNKKYYVKTIKNNNIYTKNITQSCLL